MDERDIKLRLKADSDSTKPTTPFNALAISVILRAYLDYFLHKDRPQSIDERRLFKKVKRWFESNSNKRQSFLYWLSVVDVESVSYNAKKIRQALREERRSIWLNKK